MLHKESLSLSLNTKFDHCLQPLRNASDESLYDGTAKYSENRYSIIKLEILEQLLNISI